MSLTRNQGITVGLAGMTVFGISAGLAYDHSLPGLSFVLGAIAVVSLGVAFLRYLGHD